MKLAVTLEHSRGKCTKAGLTSLQHQIQSALKARGINSVLARKTDKEVIVPVGISRKELEGILEKGNVLYQIEIRDEEEITQTEYKQQVPGDYGPLKGKVKEQSITIGKLESELAQTSESLKSEKLKLSGLQASLNETKARFGDMNVTDFLAEMMLRENKSWESFTSSYQEALEMSSEMYDFPIGELESECLNYKPLNNKHEFQKIKEDFEKAQQAQKLAKENQYIRLDENAKEILDKGHKLIEKDKALTELTRELSAYASQRKIRIAVNINENNMNITLPFIKKQEYCRLEEDLIENINTYLKSNKLQYDQEDFHGLLRYNISGIKKRAKNKLITTITTTNDIFSRLCGQKEAVRVETC